MEDLNSMSIPTDCGGEGQEDYSCKYQVKQGSINVYFKDLEKHLIEKILEHKNGVILGCVAWLTSEPILKALAQCKNVQIIVQKEDFLRPDVDANNNWAKHLRKLYSKLKNTTIHFNFKTLLIEQLSVCSGVDEMAPIRCVGNHNSEKNPAFPRMHNKFMIFCYDNDWKSWDNKDDINMIPAPSSVWTGSFNFTKNATQSFENALYIEGAEYSKIINSYLKEYCKIYAFSEQLDWESKWVTPEFRIGT